MTPQPATNTQPHRPPPDSTPQHPGRTLLTVEAAATQLSIGRTTMYALIKAGHITTIRIGRLRRVPPDALTTYTTRLRTKQRADDAA